MFQTDAAPAPRPENRPASPLRRACLVAAVLAALVAAGLAAQLAEGRPSVSALMLATRIDAELASLERGPAGRGGAAARIARLADALAREDAALAPAAGRLVATARAGRAGEMEAAARALSQRLGPAGGRSEVLRLGIAAALGLAVLLLVTGAGAPPALAGDVRTAPPAPSGGTTGLYDPVTGLPGRRKLAEHVARLQHRSETPGQPVTLLHIDLAGFREVNETFGRDLADKFLCHVADTLRGSCGAEDMAVRSGADEFMLLLLGLSEEEEVREVADSLGARIGARTVIDGHTLRVPATTGATMAALDTPITEVIGNAETALAEARRLGSGRVSIFTSDLADRLRRRRETAAELRRAVERDEIEPLFQPQVDAATGAVTGVEALVRWRHPTCGVLAPWQFLEIAEEDGLGGAIGAVMRRKSFRRLAGWKRLGLRVPRIALNFTAAELRREGIVDTLLFDADRAGLRAEEVTVELLESAMIETRDDPVVGVLAQLSEAGFRVELDDFGTGHASIANLHRIHVDGIKIDRSFVMRLHERPEQQKLTSAMLSLAAALQIDTIAEGVESAADAALLTRMGCRKLQGFAIGRPMPGDEATAWIRNHLARGATPQEGLAG